MLASKGGWMRDLTWDEFRDAVGTRYEVETAEGRLALSLAVAQPLAHSQREGGAFRLEFLGPATPTLPQAIYKFARDGSDPFEIFIVPVGAEPGAIRYEAIFY
jgi:hypothetical protein